MVYFDQILYVCMSILSYHWHEWQHFMMDEALLCISPVGCCQLVKMLITLEQHDIFGSTFANLLYLHYPATGMQSDVKGLLSISSARLGLLV